MSRVFMPICAPRARTKYHLWDDNRRNKERMTFSLCGGAWKHVRNATSEAAEGQLTICDRCRKIEVTLEKVR